MNLALQNKRRVGWILLAIAIRVYPIQIVSYNTENLFDYTHDTLKNDTDYTVDGSRHWSYTRYKRKVDQVARVVCNIGGWDTPAIVGLCEIENERCLRDLRYVLYQYHYESIHYESEDERGIDVAVLYDPKQVTPIRHGTLKVDLGTDKTRDILRVEWQIQSGQMTSDTLYMYICHLPSMRGGAAASEWKRRCAKDILQHDIDSLLNRDVHSLIVVMGDMNTSPKNDLRGMTNRMCDYHGEPEGTHWYEGRWDCLDQFYVSPGLDRMAQTFIYSEEWLMTENKDGEQVPRRTFHGWHYDAQGYSDHLPIVMQIP
ncbi:MAG: endonuclease/exonuclease/phosphatase family protein [Paludibacteraceae bacterium]|nr:endonuclease/exonuclease/phosphatase family protein [Paludibacteraceae bacterium]